MLPYNHRLRMMLSLMFFEKMYRNVSRLRFRKGSPKGWPLEGRIVASLLFSFKNLTRGILDERGYMRNEVRTLSESLRRKDRDHRQWHEVEQIWPAISEPCCLAGLAPPATSHCRRIVTRHVSATLWLTLYNQQQECLE
jgi:hypothetical protein